METNHPHVVALPPSVTHVESKEDVLVEANHFNSNTTPFKASAQHSSRIFVVQQIIAGNKIKLTYLVSCLIDKSCYSICIDPPKFSGHNQLMICHPFSLFPSTSSRRQRRKCCSSTRCRTCGIHPCRRFSPR